MPIHGATDLLEADRFERVKDPHRGETGEGGTGVEALRGQRGKMNAEGVGNLLEGHGEEVLGFDDWREPTPDESGAQVGGRHTVEDFVQVHEIRR